MGLMMEASRTAMHSAPLMTPTLMSLRATPSLYKIWKPRNVPSTYLPTNICPQFTPTNQFYSIHHVC